MEKFAILTPDRNDRKELLQHCKEQVSRFHFKAKHYIINYTSDSEDCDIVPRIKRGIAQAKTDGHSWVVIAENDDHYPADYLDRIIPYMATHDFIGDQNTTYYNLRNNTYSEFIHRGRSSLFTTSFRISALDGFNWPPDHSPYLDIKLWEYARKKRCKFLPLACVGIKHGIGKSGGSGHRKTFQNSDPELKWLEANVDMDAFEFYKNLQL